MRAVRKSVTPIRQHRVDTVVRHVHVDGAARRPAFRLKWALQLGGITAAV